MRGKATAGAVALVVCCAPGAGTAVAAGGGCARAAATANRATLERATDSILCLVNRERARRGLRPLRAQRLLDSSARRHSRDMVARRYFSHVSLGGADVRRRVLRTGYLRRHAAAKVGETIAWGAAGLETPAALVRSFMQSSAHRRVLLDRRFRDIGVGLVLGAPVAGLGDEGATLTLDFGRR